MDSLKTKEKLILDEEQYKTISIMLKSTDEDRVVAYSCLNTLKQKESLIYTLFLRKENPRYIHEWIKYCPKLLSYHFTFGVSKDNNVITFPTIYEIVKTITKDNKDEQILKVFLSRFACFIKDSLVYDFIEDVEITCKLKNHE